MKNIVEYQMATGESAEDLVSAVNSLIGEGFQPYGEPILAEFRPLSGIATFHQPMVKYSGD